MIRTEGGESDEPGPVLGIGTGESLELEEAGRMVSCRDVCPGICVRLRWLADVWGVRYSVLADVGA